MENSTEHSGTTDLARQVKTPSPIVRLLSGSVGSIIYVLAFTPLEVVKIRQQETVSSIISSSNSPIKAFLPERGSVMLGNGLLASKSAFPCRVAPQHRVSPAKICSRLESTSYHHAVSPHLDTKSNGVIRTLLSIARVEGRAGLYAGLKPTLLQAIPNTAIYFTAYDEISTRLRQNHADANEASDKDDAKRQVYIPLVAGATARFMSSVVTAPLELVRIRQASAAGNSHGVLKEFKLLLRMNGPLALYSGLAPMVMRDVPFSALYFLGLETFKNVLSDSSWGVGEERCMNTPVNVQIMHTFVAGGCAGAIATVLTTPFDVVKTRIQIAGQAELNASSVKGQRISPGIFQHMRQIVQEEGFLTGLWKGNRTRMAKVVPGTAVMISCYELCKQLLEDIL